MSDRDHECSTLSPDMCRVVSEKAGLVVTSGSMSTAKLLSAYKTAHGSNVFSEAYFQPHRASGLFAPLAPPSPSGRWFGRILDFTGLSAADDRTALEYVARYSHESIVIVPKRMHPECPDIRCGHLDFEPPPRLYFQHAAEMVLRAPGAPPDDDTPILRRLVLKARSALAEISTNSAASEGRETSIESALIDARGALMVRLLRLGEHLHLYGEARQALFRIQEACDLAMEALETSPNVVSSIHHAIALSEALGDAAAVVDEQGRIQSAYDQAFSLTERLDRLLLQQRAETTQRDDSAAGKHAARVASSDSTDGAAAHLSRLATLQTRRGDHSSALASIREAINKADTPESRQALVLRLGVLLVSQGNHESAVQTWGELAAALRGTLAITPRRFDIIATLVRTLLALSQSEVLLSNLALAEQHLAQARPLLERMLERESVRIDWQQLVLDGLYAESELHAASGNDQATLHALQWTSRLAQHCIQRDPSRIGSHLAAARVARRIAAIRHLPVADAYMTTLREHYERAPRSTVRKLDLAAALMVQALNAEYEQRPTASRAHWERCSELVASSQLPAAKEIHDRARIALKRLEWL